VESLTVIVYDLYTLDNAGHGFYDVIAQVVLFTSRRRLPMNVVSGAERLCFRVWLISPGVGFWFAEGMSFGWRILVQVTERFMGLQPGCSDVGSFD
jgi:hypothetical protein